MRQLGYFNKAEYSLNYRDLELHNRNTTINLNCAIFYSIAFAEIEL